MVRNKKTGLQKKTGRAHIKSSKFGGNRSAVAAVLMAVCAIVLAGISFASTACLGDVKITTKVDRDAQADGYVLVRPGDSLIYTISVSSDESTSFDDPKLPDLTEFESNSLGSSSEMTGSFTNGQVVTKRTQIYTYQLVPMHQGTFNLGPAEVVADGKTYSSNVIKIKVLDSAPQAPAQAQHGAQGSGQGGDQGNDQNDEDIFSQLLQRQFGMGVNPAPDVPSANANDLYFIQAVVDKHKAYVGEQVTVSFYLVTRAQIADIDTLKYPDLKGFWKEDIAIATRLNFEPEIVNGITYQRALLASYALFPIHEGLAKIDPYQTKCKVIVSNGFGMPEAQDIVKQSGEIPIEVTPLPEANKPADFSGAVGEFTATASVDNPHVKAGNPVTLTIRLEGKGNAKLADIPKLDFGPNVQVFDPKTNMKFYPNGRSYKEFQQLIVPRVAGEVKIPPVDFWFFNPTKKQYYDVKTNELTLQVDPGDKNANTTAQPFIAKDATTTPQEQKPTMPDILLTPETKSFWPRLSTAATAGVWSSLWGVAALALGGMAWRELGGQEQREDLRQKIDKKLKRLDAAVNNGHYREVGRGATEAIHQVLGEIAGLGGPSYEFEKMAEKAPPSFKRELLPSFRSVLARLEAAGYAPDDMVGSMREKTELKKLMAEARRLLLLAAKYDFSSAEAETDGSAETPKK